VAGPTSLLEYLSAWHTIRGVSEVGCEVGSRGDEDPKQGPYSDRAYLFIAPG